MVITGQVQQRGIKTGHNVGGNIKGAATGGLYRLTIDTKNNLAYVQQKQVGVVGGMQGWDAKAPVYGTICNAINSLILARLQRYRSI